MKKKVRKPELIQHKSVWLTEETFKILRKQKIIQKKTMARIVNNLIIEKYGNVSLQRVFGEQLEISDQEGYRQKQTQLHKMDAGNL
jgi:hypothetical protein